MTLNCVLDGIGCQCPKWKKITRHLMFGYPCGGTEMWNAIEAQRRIMHVMVNLNLRFRRGSGVTGLVVLPYKNTFFRKRDTARLIRVEYWVGQSRILLHTEPWVNFPSDLLVTKLMLLPREVMEESNV